MFRISAIIMALLLVCLPAFAESENLISQDMIKAETVNYDLEVVQSGVFERTTNNSAEEYYPNFEYLSVEVSGARFGEYLVSRGDIVRKGDILATFTLDVDEVGLASLELELERAQQALEQAAEDAEEQELEMQRQLLNTSDPFERELIGLKIQRAQIAQEQYVYTQQRTIAELEERIAEMYAEQEGCVLVAPADCMILEMEFKRTGESLREGENLLLVYMSDRVLMRVNNDEGTLRYGMEVTVEVGSSKDRVSLPGRVVGADTLIPSAERSGKAYIEFEMPEDGKLTRPTVKATTVHLSDVLTVSRSAVAMDGGKYFVIKLEDGVPRKHFINAVVNVGMKQVWVLQGLTEGDEIIIE